MSYASQERRNYPTEETDVSNDDGDLQIDFSNLNITSEDIDFDEIDDDLERFQEDDMVKQALQRGIDLKKYGQELASQLKEAEAQSVEQYLANSEHVSDLHKEMEGCDEVLARMQEMLLGFQADLGGISEEIRHLQDESFSMNIRLKNRRSAEELIHKFVEHISIDSELATVITTCPVNEEFLESVIDLKKALGYLKQSEPPRDGSSLNEIPGNTYAGKTLLPELNKLKSKAVSKILDYFTVQFKALRRAKTNIQMIQQNALVKYAFLLKFLQQESPVTFDEIKNMYVECIGKTILNVFKNYYTQLIGLELIFAASGDHVAVEDAALRSVFSSKVNLNKRCDAFTLGERDRILDQVESEPIVVHVAKAESTKFPFESLMRSVIKHLCDAATSEFLFVIDFFGNNSRDTFNRIFKDTLSLVLSNIESFLLNCYDCIGILLMIKVTHSQRMIMQRRRIPVLDSFFDRISLLLWPRFKVIFDININGLRSASPKKLGAVDLTPHYVSRRYAELVSSVLTLQSGTDSFGIGGGGESMLIPGLKQMRLEIVGLLERLGNILPTPKERKVFFINNIDQMLLVFQERRVMGEEVQILEGMLMTQRDLFAEESLKGTFPHLVTFVVQTEQTFANAINENSGVTPTFSLEEHAVEAIVREFASSWRAGIQQINDEVLSYFANFRNGMEILKQVLTQLLLYYTRFQDIIKKAWIRRPPAFMKDIVTTSTFLQEIKRYSRTF